MRQNKEEDHQLNLQLKSLMQDLKCMNDNPIQRICNNPECHQYALHCSNINCEYCHLSHENCGSYLFEKFTREVQKKTAGTLSQFYQKMSQIESNFVQKINRSKKKFLYAYSVDRLSTILERKYYHMIDNIYRAKNVAAITGQEAHELFQKLIEPEIQKGCRESQLLEVFEEKTNKLLKEYLSTREWIFDSMHGQYREIPRLKQKQKKQTLRVSIDSNVLKGYRNSFKLEDLLNYPNRKIQMFSRIVYQQIQKLDNLFLFEQLNKPLSLQLAFRASQHNFSAKEFHHLCDGIESTLVLARNQYDKVIGGFTPLSWFGEGFKTDLSNETILLGVNQRVKMNLANSQKAIFCDRNMGPIFGGQTFMFNMIHSYDFAISDECNSNKKSSMNFPKSYRFKGMPIETEYVCGLKNGGNFSVREYEVYRVFYPQKKV